MRRKTREHELKPSQLRTGQVLAVISLALMTVVSAVSGLNMALPDMARSTGASQTQLTWIVDAYTVVFAGMLLLAGAVGDRFGRRLLLTAGLLVFGAASAVGFMVDSPTQLIVVRAVMGLGAAAIMPTTLSVITTSFPESERPRAIGVWVGMAGGGAVLGLIGSAVLLRYFAWNSFFALNVLLAVLALIGTIVLVPNSVENEAPLDVLGGVLAMITVGSLVFGIIEGPERGWDDTVTVISLTAAIVTLAAFVNWELHIKHPLLDPRLFRNRAFAAGSLAITIQFFCSFGMFFIALQYLQFVAGLTPLRAALALLPMPLVMIPAARNTPKLSARIGFRRVVPVGLLVTGIGLFIMCQAGVELNYWVFDSGLAIFALGMALAGTPSTTALTASLPQSKQGVASAVNDTARELGSALGIAILGSALNQQYRDTMRPVISAMSNLPDQLAEIAMRSVAFTSSPELTRYGVAGQQLADDARGAFVDGVGVALGTASAVAVVGAVIVLLLSPSRSVDASADPSTARVESEGANTTNG